MDEYLKQYGTMSLSLLVSEYVRRSPEFPGDVKLAHELGIMLGKLEKALREWGDKQ